MKLEILFKGAKDYEFVTYTYIKSVWVYNENFTNLLYFEHNLDGDGQGEFINLDDVANWKIINKDY